VADVPSGSSWTPLPNIQIKRIIRTAGLTIRHADGDLLSPLDCKGIIEGLHSYSVFGCSEFDARPGIRLG
jgi:hypothetical protein